MQGLLHRLAISPFGRSQRYSSIPARLSTIRVRCDTRSPRQSRRGSALPLTTARTMRPVPTFGTIVSCLGLLPTLGLSSTDAARVASRAQAELSSYCVRAVASAVFATEAFLQLAIPECWTRGEERWARQAMSSKGAPGLMQIMPGTWVEPSARYGVGLDPFDPHDNILAGTAYRREMLDRFGLGGFLAAYNVGPRRCGDSLETGQPLPGQTAGYASTLASLVGIERRDFAHSAGKRTIPWQQGSVFVEQSGGVSAGARSVLAKTMARPSNKLSSTKSLALVPRAIGLFVQRWNEIRSSYPDDCNRIVSDPVGSFHRFENGRGSPGLAGRRPTRARAG